MTDAARAAHGRAVQYLAVLAHDRRRPSEFQNRPAPGLEAVDGHGVAGKSREDLGIEGLASDQEPPARFITPRPGSTPISSTDPVQKTKQPR